MVERQVHGVAGLGVGELEVQLGAGRQAGAGTAEGDARRGQLAQLLPGVGRGRGAGGHGYLVLRSRQDAWKRPAVVFHPTAAVGVSA